MKFKDITPKDFACGIGACPKLLQTDDDQVVIIGASVRREELGEHADGIGSGEQAIMVPAALLKKAFSR